MLNSTLDPADLVNCVAHAEESEVVRNPALNNAQAIRKEQQSEVAFSVPFFYSINSNRNGVACPILCLSYVARVHHAFALRIKLTGS